MHHHNPNRDERVFPILNTCHTIALSCQMVIEVLSDVLMIKWDSESRFDARNKKTKEDRSAVLEFCK